MRHGEMFRESQARLRAYIEDHGLAAGDALPPEGKLAEELGISRLSLREATRSLQTLGVIEARPGRGLFVSDFSFRPILEQLPYGLAVGGAALSEVLVVRQALEEGLIEVAAKHLGPDDWDELDALVDEMARCEADGEPVAPVDRAFHRRLYEPLGNRLVSSMIDLFWELLHRLSDSVPEIPDRRHPADVHRRIVTALRAGDGLTDAMRGHFVHIHERLAAIDAPK
ncbi:FadR/GntR family transcriptional regulator [Phytoactinopolyspora halotolerans]|uniref:FadR family transcriptional regulator n=1 Tax=Phytoactinopolyspora halotolerans TaxID=1981512 RepID=A0A6L9SEX1_9ACTN|nr:FadR/GntR family transcriptional regulator [Phytoactinopolyspora halotolerans]NEE03138.1 FadR family transcriptional regulator [Phytoactinopolyspora halotolerans]